jgi:transcriptional regulator with XRE-family HTH domain
MGRTLRELREAKGLTYQSLVARTDLILKKQIEDALREQGMDMRGAWRIRDELLERLRVRPETVERWEKVGFGVQRGTRAIHSFYRSPAFLALVRVLDAEPDDLDEESNNVTLQPGDTVVRPVDDEGYATSPENAAASIRFLVFPDGFGGTFLKEAQYVTDADLETIKTYLEEEATFLDTEQERVIDAIVQDQLNQFTDLDAEVRRLLEEQED